MRIRTVRRAGAVLATVVALLAATISPTLAESHDDSGGGGTTPGAFVVAVNPAGGPDGAGLHLDLRAEAAWSTVADPSCRPQDANLECSGSLALVVPGAGGLVLGDLEVHRVAVGETGCDGCGGHDESTDAVAVASSATDAGGATEAVVNGVAVVEDPGDLTIPIGAQVQLKMALTDHGDVPYTDQIDIQVNEFVEGHDKPELHRTGPQTIEQVRIGVRIPAPDLPVVLPMPEPPPPTIVRVQGADRYGTAAALSRRAFPDGAPAAVVASGEGFADALVAGPIAHRLGGPLLLTQGERLPLATLLELRRLQPEAVLVVGGSRAVSDVVLDAIDRASGTVRRIGGEDRFSTAALLSAAHVPAGATTAFVATGQDFADAVTGGAAAARMGAPVLLATADGVPRATADELARLDVDAVHLLGGTSAMGDAVTTQLLDALSGGLALHRHAGPDRYATATEVSVRLFGEPTGRVLVATGEAFADALAASALGDPVLLTSRDEITAATVDQVERLGTTEVLVLGGTAAVADAVGRRLGA